MPSSKMPDYCSLSSIKSKIKAEDERKIRGLSFAKLYFANKDYDKALTYLNEYLSIKNNSAEAYRVLGDVHEALDNSEKSLEAYKKSYYIDKSQDNLLLKICEKLETSNVDIQTIKSWLNRLEKKYPNHQSVFNLKDKLQLENGNSGSKLEDTFRDLSNVKLSDLTDDKSTNLSCSFLNSKSPSFTPNQFKSLERSQDRLFKKVIEIEENFNKKTDQLIELAKENQTMFGQLKNEIDKIDSALGKLQLGQREIKVTIDDFMNGEYEQDEVDEDDEEATDGDEQHEIADENNPNSSFLSCNSNQTQNTSDVFSRLGAKQTPNLSSTTTNLNQTQQQKVIPQQPSFHSPLQSQQKKSIFNQPQPQQTILSPNLPMNKNQTILPAPVLNLMTSSVKSPLDQMISTFSKINPVNPVSSLNNLTISTPTTTTSTPVQAVNQKLALSKDNTKPPLSKDNTKPPLSELFKDQDKNKWECKSCYAKNEMNRKQCICCEEPNPALLSTTKQQTSTVQPVPFSLKPSLDGGFVFGSVSMAPSAISSTQSPQQQKPQNNKEPSVTFSFNNASNNAFVFGQTTDQKSSPQLPSFSPSKQPATSAANIPLQLPIFGQSSFAPLPATGTTFLFGQNLPVTNVLSSTKTLASITTPTKVEESTFSIKTNASVEQPTTGNGEDEPQIDFKPVIPLPPKVDVITGEENEKVLFTHRAKLYRHVGGEWKERGLGDIKLLQCVDSNRYRLLMRRDQILKVCLNSPILANFEFKPVSNKNSNILSFGCLDFSEEKSKPEVFLIKFKTEEIADRFKEEVYKVVNALGGEVDNCSTAAKINGNESKTMCEPPPTREDKPKNTYESAEFDDLEIIYVKEPKSTEEKENAKKLKLPINFFSYEDAIECSGCYGCKDYIPKLNYELKSKENKENSVKDAEEQTLGGSNNSENIFSSALADAGTTKSTWLKSTEQPKWMKSALTPIFSSTQKTDSENNDPEAENLTLNFEPVIPLPPKVDVVTGEEDEEVLFSKRAKLYKFTVGEWKERGLGDFKVLRHKETKKIRFLMRREQVHKICLNHIVDKNLKIGLRPQQDTIYQWSTTDFSENPQGEPSNFNLRFKNRDIGIQFIETLRKNIEGFEKLSD